jgi:hypothetical protein
MKQPVLHVPSLDDSQLELILITMSVRIVPTMAAYKDDTKSQAVHDASLRETYNKPIAVLLTLDVVFFVDLVLDGVVMGSSDEDLVLTEVKYSVEKGHFILLALLEENAFPECSVGYPFIGKVH